MTGSKSSAAFNNLCFVICSAIFVCLCVPSAHATPEYSERTSQGCKICHTDEESGELSSQGLEYAASGYTWPPQGGYRVLSPMKKKIRLMIGILHLVGGFLWFGTILYVHLILQPKYAERGLPKGEVLLGLISMSVVGVTGILLTLSRIKSISILYSSPWGQVLSVKIFLYTVMVSSALLVVLFIGPKLKSGADALRRNFRNRAMPERDVFDPETLSVFDGKEGMPSYIAYKGKVYDVGGLKLWNNGTHMKHSAGLDLTDALPKAPHGDEKLERLKIAGSYDASLHRPKTFAQKAFYFIAYMNLVIVFFVLFVLAVWIWGL